VIEPKSKAQEPDANELVVLRAFALNAVQKGNLDQFKECIERGMDIDYVHPNTGLPLLHMAVGLNHKDMVRFMLQSGAKVTPDRNGRWPSTVAALCEVDGEICDMISDAEAALGDV
jgi:hypothetical protein